MAENSREQRSLENDDPLFTALFSGLSTRRCACRQETCANRQHHDVARHQLFVARLVAWCPASVC